MTLFDFEQKIGPKILQRGKNYFANGEIVELWQEDAAHFCAIVEGGEPYDVQIWLNDTGTIINHACDCPYDWGEYCKHEAADLLAIRDQKKRGEPLPTAPQGKRCGSRALLEEQTKETLIDLVMDFAKDYELRQEIRYYLDEEYEREEWDD